MWNWKKRKRENIDINAEGSEHIRTRKKNNAGFTLVEILVSVAIFSLMVAPLMSGFIISNKLNNKGRQTEQALTIAQDLMDGIKSFGLEELAKQINTGNITIVTNGDDTTAVTGTDATYDVETSTYTPSYQNSVFKSNTYAGSVAVKYTDSEDVEQTEAVYLGKYQYYLEDILMGSEYFDARIVITQNEDNTYLISQTSYYQTFFSDLALSSMKYYDVTIDVYVSDGVTGSVNDNGHRATYTGTIFDKAG